MFGKNMKSNGKREAERRAQHYEATAKRFALDAKMFRCRAAVHVGNKDDIVFWSMVLKHFKPEEKFHFIAGSRNEYGRETYGVTQCLKYYNYLSPSFFICIDSDYRYLLQNQKMNARNFVLQTYTYSFENHHCFIDGLDNVCSRATHMENTVFDFRRFLTRFSRILYELFIWHLYFQNTQPALFSQADFDNYIVLPNSRYCPLIRGGGMPVLDDLQERVSHRLDTLRRKYPQINLNRTKGRYRKLGLTPENVYLYIRGHNLYDLVLLLCKEVCKTLLRKAKEAKKATPEEVKEVYRGRYSVDFYLRQNLKFGCYPPMLKLEKDIRLLLG